ncbi:MAG: FAD:protein FMN transferase [Planctomycetaceae bacterium]|nr:FAD:protein FMN transferase [Planctomycetaceae bacterium]
MKVDAGNNEKDLSEESLPAFRDGIRARTGMTMGTSFRLALASDLDARQITTLLDAAQDRFDEVDRLMSTYRADSEIRRFNVSESTDWFPVSMQTAKVVSLALEISRQTEGVFDVTVAPLVQRWKFGPQHMGADALTTSELPTQTELDELRKQVGFEHLQVRLESPALKKDIPELCVDLAAIAKGFGVDEAAEYLKTQAVENRQLFGFLIEIGGETRVFGHKGIDRDAKEQRWVIGVQKPQEQSMSIHKKYLLTDLALATSGGCENFRVVDGKRFSHIIDPQVGRPKDFADVTGTQSGGERLGSVSVVDSSCAKADALATSLFVLGPEKGLELAIRHNWAVMFLMIRPDGSIREIVSPKFTGVPEYPPEFRSNTL